MYNLEEKLRDEIRSLFLLKDYNYDIYLLLNPKDYPCYFISKDNWKGVGIPISSKFENFVYKFENIKLVVNYEKIGNKEMYLLELLTDKDFDVYNFSLICVSFLLPGENGELRREIENNPQTWVDSWKELIGNKASEERAYPLLGELVVLKKLLDNNENAIMTNQGSIDIETNEACYEIKSTIIRGVSQIEIHSKEQLKPIKNKPLYLYFVRFEESIDGISIDSIYQELINRNYNMKLIDSKIGDMNTLSRKKTYKINEIRKYLVNEDFPRIIDESFKDGKIPSNIEGIKYTINLSGIDYKVINY